MVRQVSHDRDDFAAGMQFRGGNRLFNARAETVETLPSFRDAFKRSRVIVPIDAFYEWENPEHLEALGTPIPKKAPKQPWAFLPAKGSHFALAGLASIRAGANGAPLRTFTLITTEANAVVGRIHDHAARRHLYLLTIDLKFNHVRVAA